jgi:hypothetical protein
MLLSFPRGTEMFQFPRFPLPVLCVQTGVTPHHGCWVSPFGYPRIKAWSAAPRGFSQPPTSFIGVRCQGIHRWLFVAWKNKDARTRYAVLKERGGQLEAGRLVVNARMPPDRSRGGSALQIARDCSLKTEERTVGRIGSHRQEETPATDDAFRSGLSESPTRESQPRCVEALTP